ncbi:helix-turn-helix transcriptional regulator [Kibdelosporangium philippinense]|uniref:Helix-turn-helix transcriptional regulator n=1 Tax=Kibdelosporangium philippinense TaxID=211113 RepID=A0ABS8Z576_9PSEU|nr:helix-turn-helix domain-containing protein [Kibdelosporangium philippinense]MCE7003000.1 helix-turn-helix transcriptional regulator [Kibdelosporangium philippinense]
METELDQRVHAELMDARNDRECAISRTLQVLDGKWTTLIVRELLAGPLRFTELRAGIGPVSAKTLTDRLRALEHQGIITRTIYPEVPPRVVYELTEQGLSLRNVLHAMLRWGRTNPA